MMNGTDPHSTQNTGFMTSATLRSSASTPVIEESPLRHDFRSWSSVLPVCDRPLNRPLAVSSSIPFASSHRNRLTSVSDSWARLSKRVARTSRLNSSLLSPLLMTSKAMRHASPKPLDKSAFVSSVTVFPPSIIHDERTTYSLKSDQKILNPPSLTKSIGRSH